MEKCSMKSIWMHENALCGGVNKERCIYTIKQHQHILRASNDFLNVCSSSNTQRAHIPASLLEVIEGHNPSSGAPRPVDLPPPSAQEVRQFCQILQYMKMIRFEKAIYSKLISSSINDVTLNCTNRLKYWFVTVDSYFHRLLWFFIKQIFFSVTDVILMKYPVSSNLPVIIFFTEV